MKEKSKRESLVKEFSYSNSTKLINHIKATKAKANSSFRSQAEYVSHVDAYTRNAAITERDSYDDDKRLKYAKLLAHKRLNDAKFSGASGAKKPPKPELSS